MSPYNYSGNNPINAIDKEGSWFWVVNGNVPEKFYSKDFVDPNSFNSNHLQNVMNSYIKEYEQYAPKVAEYMKKTNIQVGLKDISDWGAYHPEGDIILIGSDTYYGKADAVGHLANLKRTTFHETIHKMGYGEYGAWGATIAAGLVNKDYFFEVATRANYITDGLNDEDKAKFLDKFYIKDNSGAYHINSAQKDNMWDELYNEGVKINGRDRAKIDNTKNENNEK